METRDVGGAFVLVSGARCSISNEESSTPKGALFLHDFSPRPPVLLRSECHKDSAPTPLPSPQEGQGSSWEVMSEQA